VSSTPYPLARLVETLEDHTQWKSESALGENDAALGVGERPTLGKPGVDPRTLGPGHAPPPGALPPRTNWQPPKLGP
jgi:hypothetical protein